MELKKKIGVFTTFRGGVRTEVVKIHNFFFSNESFPKTKNIELKNLILHFCNVLTGSLSFFAIGKQQFLDQGIIYNNK